MKICSRLWVNTLISLSVSAAYVSTVNFYVRAQGRTTPPVAVRRAAEADLISREWNLTHMGDGEQFKKEQITLFPQIKEDFKLIQIVNNDLMELVFVKKLVDYKLISASTEEINKRARRLDKNLVLPKADTEEFPKYQGASDVDQLKASLLSLDHSIMSFVTNPLFNSPNVINPGLAGAAERDLKKIIHSSDAIKSNVKKLNKTAKK